MSSSGRGPFGSVFSGIPRAVLTILVACIAIWFVEVGTIRQWDGFWSHLKLSAPHVLHGEIWTFVTYQAMHDPFGVGHVLFNMLSMLFFAQRLERRWGTWGFVRYFLACGIGGGVLYFLVALLLHDSAGVVGASAAIMGVLVAWALIWPTEVVLLFMIIPIQVRHLVLILVLIDVMLAWLGGMGGNATGAAAHVGGALTGWAYLSHAHRISPLVPNPARWWARLRQRWRARHMKVVDRDFDAWLKQNDDRDTRH